MGIRIDLDRCIGCRRCEIACSLNHYKRSSINPKKSRIRAWIKGNEMYPIVADEFKLEECTAVKELMARDKAPGENSIFKFPFDKKTWFKEPDTAIILRCDLCGDPPDPYCVKWCPCNAIVLIDDDNEIIPCTLENS